MFWVNKTIFHVLYGANLASYDKGFQNLSFNDICFILLDKIRKSVANYALIQCDYYGYM